MMRAARFASGWLACLLLAAAASAARAQTMDPVLHDNRAGTWRASASDDVRATLRPAADGGSAACLDFNFGDVSGYASLSRELQVDYPANFEFTFDIRGVAPHGALQFKLVDDSGENVWWVNRPDFAFPRDWQRVHLRKRHVSFAWGPTPDRELRHSARVEFVVVRGQDGNRGSVCIDNLAFHELPAPTPLSRGSTVVTASSALPDFPAQQVFDGSEETAWRSEPSGGRGQSLTLDFGEPREFGGLVLHWLPGLHASRYAIDVSDDANRWRTLRSVARGNGGTDPHLLTETLARYVRVRMRDGPAKAYGLAEVEVKDPGYGESSNAFIDSIAKSAPRGHYPRAFAGEQTYWTVLGIDGGGAHGLLSEDGALEPGTRAASIEPFLVTEDGLLSWADAEVAQSLLDGYLPIPTVTWTRDDWTMRVTAIATGERGESQLLAQYALENRADRARVVTLALATRPFQVNPPTQFLNQPGGVTPIRALRWDGRTLFVNGKPALRTLQRPDRFIATDFDAGDIADLILKPKSPPIASLDDETGLASGILLYRLAIPPRGNRVVSIVAPLEGEPAVPARAGPAWVKRQQDGVAATWRKKLDPVTVRLPPAGQALADTLRSALAHVLISRDGPALQPGTRSYARSWIRDGAMMSDALMRMGHAEVAREYADWFAPHQFSSGKIPCCVDGRGADPVAENDSQGEFIHLVGSLQRYAPDRGWLRRLWPRVSTAFSYMNLLSQSERTALNETAGRRAFFGLMPPSISHEGYSDKPAYSYWDDFWSVAGYKAAVGIAGALGQDGAGPLSIRRDEFRNDIAASLRASMAQHQIDYLPASADRGDFDPTATTVALSVAGEQSALPQEALRRTFERYWDEFAQRRDGTKTWNEFTPYELRAVGAFLRLGWRERAIQALDYFLAYRRPAAWNQWAEVVGRDPRQPRFIGDMPHAWIASDFIQCALDLFAYEREADAALVLAAGMPVQWLDGDGIGIAGLRTPYGRLKYELRREGDRVLLTIADGIALPPGGLVFPWPYASPPERTMVDGQPVAWDTEGRLPLRALPAVIEFRLRP